MPAFNLKIVTPHGVHYEGEAEAVTVRTVTGDVSIWPNHINLVTALGVGKASVTVNGNRRTAACASGVLSVLKNDVTILANTFEWKEDIDLERAKENLAKYKEELKNAKDKKESSMAKIRIQRELTREAVKTEKE